MRLPHFTTLSLVHIISRHQRDNLNVFIFEISNETNSDMEFKQGYLN